MTNDQLYALRREGVTEVEAETVSRTGTNAVVKVRLEGEEALRYELEFDRGWKIASISERRLPAGRSAGSLPALRAKIELQSAIVGRTILLIATVLSFAAPAAGETLFPAPLHITRELTDPFSGSRVVIDEYCHGNRVVSVNGRRTAIAEYDVGQITTIDFDAGTYSVTKFEDLARVYDKGAATIRGAEWRVESRDGTIVAERKDAHGRQIVRVTADRRQTVSRAALDVLMGAAWPRRPEASAEVVATALRSDERYHLPLEHVTRFETDGEIVETKNVIVRIGSELPPPEVFTIPPGARLVEADAVAARRMLEELDGQR